MFFGENKKIGKKLLTDLLQIIGSELPDFKQFYSKLLEIIHEYDTESLVGIDLPIKGGFNLRFMISEFVSIFDQDLDDNYFKIPK